MSHNNCILTLLDLKDKAVLDNLVGHESLDINDY